MGGRRGEAAWCELCRRRAWPEGWGALGSGRADGAGANALLGTWRLQESTVCFSDWRAGPLVQEGRTWKECPGLLEQGGLADCLCLRPWWELTFQLG